MFPDSAVTKWFSLSDRKTSYLASFGLAPYFTSLLEDLIKCEEFFFFFDESMNDVLQTKQIDFHTRYLTSNFLGHCTASDMVSAFESVTTNLNLNNLIQLSMDGPNVNWAFYKKIDSTLATEHVTLLNVGSCSLHKVHGACKTAMDAVNWKIDKFLRSLYQLFHDTPARRDFVKVSGTSIFPLQFCKHRWLENTSVTQRALNLMEPLS
ncbi:hypothetical protein ACJMK2_009936 [Sinanodonta woodiana]|uniref:Uncharacterized protein n=1 Tax=Sinanodonta woodiana TaxID=1069815 RepID=A0ABD3VGT7_SINWO